MAFLRRWVLAGLLACTLGWAEETTYLRAAVSLASQKEADRLAESGLLLNSCCIHLGETEVLVQEKDFPELWSLGLPYRVVGKLSVPPPPDEPTIAVADYRSNYLNYADMITQFEEWRTANPRVMSRQQIGTTLNNNPIWAYRIFFGRPTAQRKSVVISSLTHAREWITGSVGLWITDELLRRGQRQRYWLGALANTEVWVIPALNPDGYVHSWVNSNTRLWRKNRRNNGNGTFGVDVNRNFGTGWGGSGSSGNTSSETYRGPSANSERETAAYIAFMNTLSRPRAVVDFHSYSQLILWPYGYTSSPMPTAAFNRHNTLGQEMRSTILARGGLPYTQGPISTTLYLASGGSVDHWFATRGMDSFTIELRDTGQFGFMLPAAQIPDACEEAWDSFEVLFRNVAAQPL